MNENRKRPWLAVLLSAFIPGLGQIYNGTLARGAVLLAMNFTIAFLNKDLVKQVMEQKISGSDERVFWSYMVAGLLLTGFAMIDAKMAAERINHNGTDA